MERITISLDDALLAALDHHLTEHGYGNRSEAIRDAIRDRLAGADVEAAEDAPCVGCVVYMYNHRERALSSRLVEAQHHHPEIPAATLHLHVDADTCLEATILNGRVAEVRRMADCIIAQTGVRHGRLHLIPLAGAPSCPPEE